MGRRGLRIWDVVVAVLGFLLILSLFLKWYEQQPGDLQTGWQSLAFVDKVVLIAGLVAMAAPIAAIRRQTPSDASRYLIIVAVVALLTTAVLIGRIVNPPELVPQPLATKVHVGAYVALALAIAVTLSALAGMRSRVASRAPNSSARAA